MKDALAKCAFVAALLLAPAHAVAVPGDGADGPPARPGWNPLADTTPLVFDSEVIRLAVVGDSLEVRGTYIFLCRSAAGEDLPLFYPFPSDSLLGGARMVSLEVRTGEEAPAPAGWEEPPGAAGVRWWLPPCRGDTLVAEAVYRQKTALGYARYIVTTTRIWGRPLAHARFEIRLPPRAVPIDFSFPFERRERNGEAYYLYEARDFLPDRDIVVHWRP